MEVDKMSRVFVLRKKKFFFCDKHEEASNISYRNELIKKYYSFEKDTYQWVHLTEAAAME